jgi:hypothetical protein
MDRRIGLKGIEKAHQNFPDSRKPMMTRLKAVPARKPLGSGTENMRLN